MHQLGKHLLVVDSTCTLLPLAHGRVEVIHYESSGCPLAGPVAGVFVLCQDELAWLPGEVTLQVSGVDRHGQNAAAFDVSSDLEALSIARAAEDPEDERPSIHVNEVED